METPDDIAAAVARIADRLKADDTTLFDADVLPTLRRAAEELKRLGAELDAASRPEREGRDRAE